MTSEEIKNEIQEIDKKLDEIGIQPECTPINEADQGQIEPESPELEVEKPKQPPCEQIAICGFAESSWRLAPWGNPDWEIWGLNGLHKVVKWHDNIKRWFQLHPPNVVLGEDTGGGKEHVKFLNSLKIPLFISCQFPEVPKGIPYPWEEVREAFYTGSKENNFAYLTNTISEMIALAILEIYKGRKIKKIGLYGVDMAHSTEYGYQKPSCEFYLGILEGLRKAGVIEEWILPKESTLLKAQYIYGMEDEKITAFSGNLIARKKYLTGKYNEQLKLEGQHHDAQQQFLGAMQELDSIQRNMASQ